MYDVPVAVKELFKRGRTKKEYEILAYKTIDRQEFRVLHEYNSESLSFIVNEYFDEMFLYSSESPEAFEYATIYFLGGGAEMVLPVREGTETNTKINVKIGDRVELSGLHASKVYMRGLTGTTPISRYQCTITNDTLVKESVKIDERMCSADNMKFGLCEGASLEFQYFNLPSILGCDLTVRMNVYESKSSAINSNPSSTIRPLHVTKGGIFVFTLTSDGTAEIDIDRDMSVYNVELDSEHSEESFLCEVGDIISIQTQTGSVYIRSSSGQFEYNYELPIGQYHVEDCPRQASTGIRKVTAYNKLMSKYLDAKANMMMQEAFSSGNVEVTMFDIMRVLLNGYSIMPSYEQLDPVQISWGGVPWDTNNVTGTITAKFKNEYGINNPINYKEWSALSSSNVKVYLRSSVVTFQASKKYLFINTLKGSFEELERRAYERVRYIFDAAQLCHPTSGNIYTGDQLMNNLMVNDIANGWPGFCSIMVNNDDGLTQDIYYYSTMLWEYEEANNIAHTSCLGTIDDFINRLQDTEFEDNEFSEITIFMPQTYGIINASGTTATLSYMIDGRAYSIYPKTYTYYADSSHTSASGTITGIIEGDGAAYQAPMTATNFGNFFAAYQIDDGKLTSTQLVKLKISELPDFTLREIATAVYESQCQFGHLDRVSDLFLGVPLNKSQLYPADDLYPNNSLYPGGAAASFDKLIWSKLWADEGNLQSWRYLIITYKGLDDEGNEADFTLQRTINENGTQNYNMSDNWILRNTIWSKEDVGALADSMVEKMRNISWFPFEMWLPGLPYLEVGDMIEIPLGDVTYPTYILQRQLSGIHNLQDTYINGTLAIF